MVATAVAQVTAPSIAEEVKGQGGQYPPFIGEAEPTPIPTELPAVEVTSSDLTNSLNVVTESVDKTVASVASAITSEAAAQEAAPDESAGFSWPVRGALTTYFSWGHPGIDIANAYGTPVTAVRGGTVTIAGWDDTGYGNTVVITSGNDFVRYGHFSVINVSLGQYVPKGNVVGYMGCTGRCTGPHLHLEIHLNGVAVDPLTLLQ